MAMHENTYTGGRLQRIAALLRDGCHKLEAWGNNREGFEAYLVNGTSGVSVSGRYKRLRDLRRDALDQYGKVTVPIGRNW